MEGILDVLDQLFETAEIDLIRVHGVFSDGTMQRGEVAAGVLFGTEHDARADHLLII